MKRYIIFMVVAALTFTIGVFSASIYTFSAHKSLTQISELPSPQKAAESNEAKLWLSEVLQDFDFIGSSPIDYKYIPSSKRRFILSEPGALFETNDSYLFPQKLEVGRRYIFRNRKLEIDDPSYQILEKRFQSFNVETSIFIPHSVMSITYDPPIPVRFIDNPRIVLQPMTLVFRGKGYEGLVIRNEFEQTSWGRKPIMKLAVHDYSLIILKTAQ